VKVEVKEEEEEEEEEEEGVVVVVKVPKVLKNMSKENKFKDR